MFKLLRLSRAHKWKHGIPFFFGSNNKTRYSIISFTGSMIYGYHLYGNLSSIEVKTVPKLRFSALLLLYENGCQELQGKVLEKRTIHENTRVQ